MDRPRKVNGSPTADVDGGAPLGVRLCLPQDLVGDRGGVPLPEEQKAEQVHDRIALRPPEVTMWRLAGGIAEVEQEGGDGVGHHRALCAQHLVVADLYAAHLQHVLELGGVFHSDLQEKDRLVSRDVVILALLFLLCVVLALVASSASMGDYVDLLARFVYEPPCHLI